MKSVMPPPLLVWIIDDDIVSLFATRYGIEQWNNSCEVVDFDDGETALKILSDKLKTGNEIPDIILLDLVMPKMNGWEFLAKFEAIKGRSNKTDIYILSAFSNSKDREKARKHQSIKGYIEKPVSKLVLDDVLV